MAIHPLNRQGDMAVSYIRQGDMDLSDIDHRKSTLARGSRWDYTHLPF